MTLSMSKKAIKQVLIICLVFSMVIVYLPSSVNAAGLWYEWNNGNEMMIVEGEGLGGFDDPEDVAIDQYGNLYVTDTDNHRIQKYTLATEMWSELGNGFGSAVGEFDYPGAIDVDGAGNIYVADSNNNRIQMYSVVSEMWSELGNGYGPNIGEFDYPEGIAVDGAGNVYVADTDNHRIQKYTVETETWSELGNGYGDVEGEFNEPEAITTDSAGNIYVVDTENSRIQIYTVETETWSELGNGNGSDLGEFNDPQGIALDGAGNIYVADKDNNRIQKYTISDESWSILAGTGDEGTLLGEFDDLIGIAVDNDGNIYAADSDNHRIQKFTITDTGGYWTQFGKLEYVESSEIGEFYRPDGIAVDSKDNVYVVDSYNHRIQMYTAATGIWSVLGNGYGSSIGQFDYPEGIAIDGEGNIYVGDTDNDRIQMYTLDTRTWSVLADGYGDDVGQFNAPSGLAVDSEGNVYVADRGNHRVQKYTLTEGIGSWSILGNDYGDDVGYFYLPYGVMVDSEDNLYISDSDNHRIQKYNSEADEWSEIGAGHGTGIGQLDLPVGTVMDSEGNIYVTEYNNDRIQKYNPSTNVWSIVGGSRYGIGSGEFEGPVGLAFDSKENLYITDYRNHRIQILRNITMTASASSTTPVAGEANTVTLIVMDGIDDTDSTFSETLEVTVSGFTAAANGTYGSINGTELSTGSHTLSVTFTNGTASLELKLYNAMTQTIGFSIVGEIMPKTNSLSITPAAGDAASMSLSTDITASATNGGLFTQQPIVTLRDSYGNTSTGDSSTVVTVTKHDTGNWTLTGTSSATASEGLVSFTGLGATNSAEVIGAQLAFDAIGLRQLLSQTVILPRSTTTVTDPGQTSPTQPNPVTPTPTPAVAVFNQNLVNEDRLVQSFEAITASSDGSKAAKWADIQGHWAEETINIFTQLDFINGYQDGTFRPNSSITRAEFAAILYRVFQIQGGSSMSTVLSDIDGIWAKDSVEILVSAGVINGYTDRTFRPNQTITREEMVVMLSRIINLSNIEKDITKGNFNDLNSAYATDEIEAAAQASIVSGKGAGAFDPSSNATRVEALQIILNVLKLNTQLKTLLDSLS